MPPTGLDAKSARIHTVAVLKQVDAMAIMNDEERARALSQIPQDSYQAPRANSFGDSAAAQSNSSVQLRPSSPMASGPLSRIAAPLSAPSLSAPAPAAQPSVASRLSTVARNGNSYSGGNIGGDVSVNGASAGGGYVGAAPAPALASAAPAPQPVSSVAFNAMNTLPSAAGAQQISAPQVSNSSNDFAARKQLENLATSASSITNTAKWGGWQRGEVPPDVAAYQQALATDAALQQAQPRLDQAALQGNVDLQQTGMREQGADARSRLSSMTDLSQAQLAGQDAMARTQVQETGATQRSAMQTLGGIQEAQLRATAAKTPPAGYRTLPNGNLQAIPGGPADLSVSKEGQQQTKDTQDVFSILDQARPLMNTATGSYAGAAVDQAARAFGVSTEGAQSAAQLKALQGALVSKMPKMSGPQSDKDVQLYREMAGQIGDPTIPVDQRKAAMQTVEDLNMKYLPVASDAAAYQALPSGSYFKTADGSVRRKQ